MKKDNTVFIGSILLGDSFKLEESRDGVDVMVFENHGDGEEWYCYGTIPADQLLTFAKKINGCD
jgi:hypothetical protein